MRSNAKYVLQMSFGVLAFACMPICAVGTTLDRKEDMIVNADHTLAEGGKVFLRGNVVITQGTLHIDADEATVTQDEGAIVRVVLSGGPARMREKLDNDSEVDIRAKGIDYDVRNEAVLLTGNVIITKPEGELRGESVRYDLKSERMEAGAPGSRIHMRIEPKAKEGKNEG